MAPPAQRPAREAPGPRRAGSHDLTGGIPINVGEEGSGFVSGEVQVRDLLEDLSEDLYDALAELASESVDDAPVVDEEPVPELDEPADVPEPEETVDEDVPDDEVPDDAA